VKVIAIIGYSYPELPLEPALRAFELLAANDVQLGPRAEAGFDDLQHPIHREGSIAAWQVTMSEG
jgi:hypothetical protein